MRVWGAGLFLVVSTACVGEGAATTVGEPGTTSSSSAAPSAEPPVPTTETPPATGSGPITPPPADCPSPSGIAWPEAETVQLELIDSAAGVEIYAAEYPLPGPTEGLWSQWGQGVVASDGRHFSAVGDHVGRDGNSWFYVYDPETRELTRFSDVLTLVPHQQGAWGYGKVHAQMALDRCGTVWAATYWGTRRNLEYGNGYEGDRLLSIHPHTRTIADHGPVAGRRGIPTLTIASDQRTVVASGVDPDKDRGVLVLYDTAAGAVIEVAETDQEGYRALAVDPERGILYSIGDRRLARLDPSTGETTSLDLTLPGDILRAATSPAGDGRWYGVTNDDPVLFAADGDGLQPLGEPGGYTTSLAMTPDGARIFWLPDAHGGAWKDGAGVRSMETGSGEITTVASLAGPFQQSLGLRPGGTYSVVYHEGKLILGVNASEDDSGFGTVVLVVIEGL